MKVYVDKGCCSGSGYCVSICPEVFELKNEQISNVKMDKIPVEFRQACREAAKSCPAEAISIEQ